MIFFFRLDFDVVFQLEFFDHLIAGKFIKDPRPWMAALVVQADGFPLQVSDEGDGQGQKEVGDGQLAGFDLLFVGGEPGAGELSLSHDDPGARHHDGNAHEHVDGDVPQRHEEALFADLLPVLLVDSDVLGAPHVPVEEDAGVDDAADHVEDLAGGWDGVVEAGGDEILGDVDCAALEDEEGHEEDVRGGKVDDGVGIEGGGRSRPNVADQDEALGAVGGEIVDREVFGEGDLVHLPAGVEVKDAQSWGEEEDNAKELRHQSQ